MRRPRIGSGALALVATGVGAAVALAAAVVAARHAFPTTISPLRPAGAWRAVFVAGVVGAFALYGIGCALALRTRARWPAVVAIAVAVQLAPLAAPLLLSKDVYSYWGYGRIAAVHDANPYRDAPNRWPSDPAYSRMGADWHARTSVYGPTFTLASEGDARIAGDSPRAARSLFRGLAAAGMLVVVLAAALAATNRVFAICFVGWNPLLALHFAGGGHNDALVAAGMIGALAFRRLGRRGLEGGAWAAAASIKLVALLFLLLRTLDAWRRGELRRVLGGFVVVAAIVAALATARYGIAWLGILSPLRGQLGSVSSLGLPYPLRRLGLPERATRDVLLLAFAVYYAWLSWAALRGRLRLGRCSVAFLFALSWLQPWYAVWAVPFAAVEDDAFARVAAFALSAYLLRDALPL